MRVSRSSLMKATVDMQAELEARIYEGLFARVLRYVSDRELRRRLVVARAAQKTLDKGGDS